MTLRRVLGGLLIAGVATALAAQEGPPGVVSPEFARAMQPMVEREAATDRVVVTRHRAAVNGRRLAYRAVVTETPLAGPDGRPAAVAVTYAYVVDQPAGTPERPVLFIFNGGPGASSLPLHLNGIGPRRVRNARMVDNAASPLDVADLVFVDPVGTGASMPVRGGDPAGFFGTQGDARAVIDVIARWKVANGRADAPTLLMGESYGTTRAAAILGEDAKEGRLKVKAAILVSLALGGVDREVAGPVTLLPTLAAVAWYHHRIDRAGRTVVQHYDDALAFAQSDYARALVKGSSLPPAERARVAGRMAALVGVPAAMLEAAGLVIDKPTFMATVLGSGRRTGQLDARVTRAIADSDFRPPFDDPSMTMGAEKGDRITPYLRDELGYATPSPYRSLNLGINFKWNHGPGGLYSFNTRAAFAAALKSNPDLRVMSMGGYYDITTPAYAGRFALDHTNLPAAQRTDRVYATGHSILEDDAALAGAVEDIRRFVREVAGG